MKISKLFFSIILVTALSTVLTLPSYSRPFRLEKLPDYGRNFGCSTCHLNPRGGGPLNLFGDDYKDIGLKSGDKYTKPLGQMDSDGDGFSNDKEIEVGTHPGDSKSRPNEDI